MYNLYKKLDIIPLGEAILTGKNVGSYGPAEDILYSVPFGSTFQVGTLIYLFIYPLFYIDNYRIQLYTIKIAKIC